MNNMSILLYGSVMQCMRLEPYVSRSYQRKHLRHNSGRLIKSSKAY